MPFPILLLHKLLIRVGSALRHSLQPDNVLLTPPTPPVGKGPGVLCGIPACGDPCALWGAGKPVAGKSNSIIYSRDRNRDFEEIKHFFRSHKGT